MVMKTKLFITGLALIAMTTLASAQNQGTGQGKQNATGKGMAYVDANKDGVCDNYETRTSNSASGKRNNQCNGTGQGQKRGQGKSGTRQGLGQGNQRNFVDADKNGICDNRETAAKK